MTSGCSKDTPANRVVVTGIGVISPLGRDAATTWEALVRGQSGIDYITHFDPSNLNTHFAGEVKGFVPTDYLSRRQAPHLDRFAQFAVAASLEAVKQAGLTVSPDNSGEIGVIIGTGLGGLDTLASEFKTLEERGPSRVSPFLIPMMTSDTAAAQVSIMLGAQGLNLATTSSCTSGADAIGLAYQMIRHGDIQTILAGGSEAPITPIAIAAFNVLRALSTRNSDPKLASRPFDDERDGFVMSEGASVLVLESLACAQRRGARILAEITGYGAASDAHHITQPAENGSGMARAMAKAMAAAGLGPADIDYINAHGTSTPLNDRMETRAIKSVFGDRAPHIPISSTKSMTGHLIGAAGAIEAAISVMVIQRDVIPPTINLFRPEPECDLDYVPKTARPARVSTILSNSFGFGGHNSVLVLRRFTEGA